MRGLDFGAKALGRVAALAATGFIGSAVAGCSTNHPHPTTQTASLCQDVTFPIYFAEWSDQLTDTAKQVLATAATQVKGCRIGYVSVLGLTDSKGSAPDNLELSRRRAQMVASALQSAGLPAPKFEIRGLGEIGSVTPHGKEVPLRRKTEVAIHALPPG
jgi:outer membrane protein OmpA-like peptidoglycan-associated protein